MFDLQLKEQMSNIIEVFEKRLSEVSWMDELTRSRAIIKVRTIKFIIFKPL